ncbi:MAG: hypothetical protein JNK63_08545 [Chthonomonas sp.]|nr:hypothetical protein [Chthonomonas sp.]
MNAEAEFALDLVERVLKVEVAVRTAGLELQGAQEIEYMWHDIAWEQDGQEAHIQFALQIDGEEEWSRRNQVRYAIDALPFAQKCIGFPEPNGKVTYEFKADLSDLKAIRDWIDSRAFAARCPLCERGPAW